MCQASGEPCALSRHAPSHQASVVGRALVVLLDGSDDSGRRVPRTQGHRSPGAQTWHDDRAKSKAAATTNALVTVNYVLLEQQVERLAQEDTGLRYHHLPRPGGARGGHTASVVISRGSVSQTRSARKPWKPMIPLVRARPTQEASSRWHPGIPTDERDKWGTVRVAISLQGMYGEIQRRDSPS